MRTLWRPLLISAFSITLAACSYTPNNRPSQAPNAPKLLAAHTYIQMAAQTPDPTEQQNYRLLALERFVQDKKPKQAYALIQKIDKTLITPDQENQKQLLLADLQLTEQQLAKAFKTLQPLQAQAVALPTPQQIKLHQLLGAAYARAGNIADSLAQYSQALPLIKNQYAYNKEVHTAWQLLQKQSLPSLQSLLLQTPSTELKGWLELAILTHQPNANGEQFIRNINAWRSNHRGHPANALLPSHLSSRRIVTEQTPKQVAVLLPMTGALKQSSQAIRNGILAAYYQAQANYQQTPKLHFYDTTKSDINTVYQQAVNDGASFIVGPLTKPNLEQLIRSDQINKPTLALNTVSSSFDPNHKIDLPSDLYQFGLSPIDEAIQVANIAHDLRHTNALILAPESKRGQDVAQAIGKQFEQQGGDVVAELAYNSKGNLAHSIQQVLTVDLYQARVKNLQNTIGARVRSLPRRRQDIDCIFLVAKPNTARQIQPLLRYYFAGDLPVFATSELYSGYANKRDKDLNDVLFTDMPWVLAANKGLPDTVKASQKTLQQLFPRQYQRYSKFYALGVDAYNVIPELNMLALLPKFGTNAATGTLYLDAKQHLYRQLQLAQMADGKPRVIQHG